MGPAAELSQCLLKERLICMAMGQLQTKLQHYLDHDWSVTLFGVTGETRLVITGANLKVWRHGDEVLQTMAPAQTETKL